MAAKTEKTELEKNLANEKNQAEIDRKCAELLKATRPQPQTNGGKKK